MVERVVAPERLIRLVQVLRRYRVPVSAVQLATELGVSARSIYRDVAALRAHGAVIEGEAGLGYLLQPGFLLPPLMFSDRELELLLWGLRLASEEGNAEDEAAARALLAKVRAVLPRDLRAAVGGELRTARRGDRRGHHLELRRALREERKLQINYTDVRGVRGSRLLWPLAFGKADQVHVLIAWCEQRGDFACFRVDAIENPAVQPVGYPRPRSVLLQAWQARTLVAKYAPE